MKKPVYGQIRYYQDELHDGFANTNIVQEKINADYPYWRKNPFFLLFSFLLLYLVAIPVLNLLNFFWFRIRVLGRKRLRGIRGGFVLYGNHTAHYDSFIPQALLMPWRRTYIIANPDAVSIPFIKHLTKALGAWPLPNTVKGSMRFLDAISLALKKKRVIAVYPEAHIWPFYTGIRPFPPTSFQYASRNNVPAVPIVTTYRRPKGWFKEYRRPAMDLHIGHPIYPKPGLTMKENANYMHAETLKFMKSYAERRDNVAFYRYEKKSGA